jgi:sensor c-di-GMP phosphodiesterase-like protein
VHVLKVAGSFVRTMDSDADDAKMVRSTIEMAHTLGLAAVAEGVESAAACGMLRELQCDQALGLHLGPPMTAAEFAQWNARWLTHLRPDVPHVHHGTARRPRAAYSADAVRGPGSVQTTRE